MATIVSSVIVSDRPQRDGSRHVRERHVDSVGMEHVFDYTAQAKTDANAVLAARAAWLPGASAEAELAANLLELEGGE